MIKQKGFTEQLIVYQMILYNKYNKAGYWLKKWGFLINYNSRTTQGFS